MGDRIRPPSPVEQQWAIDGSNLSEPDPWLAPKSQSAHAPASYFKVKVTRPALAAIEVLVAHSERRATCGLTIFF
jgi:hypothetical protein